MSAPPPVSFRLKSGSVGGCNKVMHISAHIQVQRASKLSNKIYIMELGVRVKVKQRVRERVQRWFC